MKNLILSTVVLVTCINSMVLYAASVPRGVATDHHIKVVMYDPNNVVLLKARYGYQTQITFAPNETIQNVSIGDSMAWQAVPINNYLFIKPVAASKTNMTVITNVNSYNFEIDSMNPDVPATYNLQFKYPEGGYSREGNPNAITTVDPTKLNWKYSFIGDRSLAPIEAFDNQQFTYFKFRDDGSSHTPAVFIVDKDRNETLTNYHMQGEYMVIDSVAKQFTLRNGSYVTTVYNDR